MNTLYYGDNLEILREPGKEETVDLVTLDPPFNSNASYNLLFKARGKGTTATPRWKASRNLAPDKTKCPEPVDTTCHVQYH